MKLYLAVFLAVLAVAFAEPRVQQHRGLRESGPVADHPYLFLNINHGRTGSVLKGFELVEEDDDNINDDDDNDNDNEEQGSVRAISVGDDNLGDNDDDDDEIDNEDDEKAPVMVDGMKDKAPIGTSAEKLEMILQNAKPTQMMVSKDQAGAIMVPDGIIEIEGQSVVDEKTGKTHLLVPQAALDAIPDGSVVALMERPADSDLDDEEEERANRVIVRRRRKGSRRNVRRRRVNNNNRNRRRRVNGNRNRNRNGNRRRRVNNNRRKNVRVVPGNRNNRRRRVNGRPVYAQGYY